MAQLSPGVQVKEFDASIVVPRLGSSTGAFAGKFTTGEVNTPTYITNTNELIELFGKPTPETYAEFSQVEAFLRYSNALYVSRVGASDMVTASSTEFNGVIENEQAFELAEATLPLGDNGIGFFSKVPGEASNGIEVAIATQDDFIIDTDENTSLVEAQTNYDTQLTKYNAAKAATNTGNIALTNAQSAQADATTNVNELEASFISAKTKALSGAFENDDLKTLIQELTSESDVIDLGLYPTTESSIKVAKIDSLNSILTKLVQARLDVTSTSETTATAATELEALESTLTTEHEELNVQLIALKEAKIQGLGQAFAGINLLDVVSNIPSSELNELAIIVKDGDDVQGYIVSTQVGSKDYRGRSNYITNVLNNSSKVYCKYDGTELTSKLADDAYKLLNGSDGSSTQADYLKALGSVSEDTNFGKKETYQLDIIIGNPLYRTHAAELAASRKDCIAFIGANVDDIVGKSSSSIVRSMIIDVNEILAGVRNSYVNYTGNIKKSYDKYNDEMRWVSLAGDAGGLRAATATFFETWYASAGESRGQLKRVEALGFNPNKGARDLMYMNSINPVAAFNGKGNLLYGQKTFTSRPSSFDRVNVRALFNHVERAIEKMSTSLLFEFNDVFTRAQFTSAVVPFLEGVQAGRGIADFRVICDETNNTPEVINNNGFVGSVLIKPNYVAEFIELRFTSVAQGVSFDIINA